MPRAPRYAGQTVVSVAKTRAEIEEVLRKYGAEQFISGYDTANNVAMIGFSIKAVAGAVSAQRQVRMRLKLPTLKECGGNQGKFEQAERTVWRVWLLVIKAKFEAVAHGISTVEREFLADVVLPDGSTLGEWAASQVHAAYNSGNMPPLLLGAK